MAAKIDSIQQRLTEWLASAKALRHSADAAEADYLAFVSEGEEDEAMWRHAGYPTYAAFIRKEVACDPGRLVNFREAVKRFGFESVRRYGVEQVRTSLLIVPDDSVPSTQDPSRPAVEAIRQELEDFIERHGVNASATQARAMRDKHFPHKKADTPRFLTDKDKRIADLLAENKSLTLKIERLRRENHQLRERLADERKARGARAARK